MLTVLIRENLDPRPKKSPRHGIIAVAALTAALFLRSIIFPESILATVEKGPVTTDISGYIKTLNYFTRTTGFTPEVPDNPFAVRERNELLFKSLERFRLHARGIYELSDTDRFMMRLDYDHQPVFGSYVATGDFRIDQKNREDRQFLDLSQTLVEEDGAFYEHRLYRASLTYESELYSIEVGRQQIPWGVGYFFTPTDVFNPFSPTQLELDERDGVDAINITSAPIHDTKFQFIYTPRGKRLHPQRFMARASRDIAGFETGLLGGFVQKDFVSGFDFRGNVKDSAVRGEFLYHEVSTDKDFFAFTLNADYNFPHNIYGMLEYSHNGEGRRSTKDYQISRLIQGDIRQLAKNYLAGIIGYDVTPLVRVENRTIFNLDDQSFFFRPEVRYSVKANTLLTVGTQIFAGGKKDEFGQARNLYFAEMKISF